MCSGPVKGKTKQARGLSRGHLGDLSPVAEIGFLQNRPVGQLSELRCDKLGKTKQTEGLVTEGQPPRFTCDILVTVGQPPRDQCNGLVTVG